MASFKELSQQVEKALGELDASRKEAAALEQAAAVAVTKHGEALADVTRLVEVVNELHRSFKAVVEKATGVVHNG